MDLEEGLGFRYSFVNDETGDSGQKTADRRGTF